jgi:hypothetical protein
MLKPKTDKNTLRFKLTDTVDSVKEKIAQEMLRLVELTWTQMPEGESRIFESQLDDIKIIVKEDNVEFIKVNSPTNEGLMTSSQAVEQVGGDGKKFKSLIYKELCDRFDRDAEMVFFTDVLKTLIEHSGQDDATPGETDDESPIHLRENKE